MTLDDIVVIACDAGREIYRIWKEGCAADTKSDGSVVTIADQRAEAIIIAGLKRVAPDIPVIAEEQDEAGLTPDVDARFFLVDPLDGTKGFSEGGNEDFTVNIGLIEDHVPVLGVVYAPASGRLWAADAHGAWEAQCDVATAQIQSARRPLSVSDRTGGWKLVGSRSYAGPKMKAFAAAVGASETLAASSSLKFCVVATGEADIYPRFGGLREWDVAAGHAVLRAAGGDVMTLTGAPLRYGRVQVGFELDGLIAYGNAASEKAARDALG